MSNKLRKPSEITVVVDGTETTLDVILADHAKWIKTYWKEGKKANLRWANLRGVDLSMADLRWTDLREADLKWADLSKADLSWADLRGANLRGVNLDYSCWPLWCGSLGVKADEALVGQLAFHLFDLAKSSGLDVGDINPKLLDMISKSSPVTKHGKRV